MISYQELRQIEKELNEIKFDGQGVGNFILMPLYLGIYLRGYEKEFSNKRKFRTYLKYLKYKWQRPILRNKASRQPNLSKLKNRWLFTSYSPRENLFKINYTVSQNLTSDQSLFVLLDKRLESFFREGVKPAFILGHEVSISDTKEWKQYFRKIEPRFKTIVSSFLKRNKLQSSLYYLLKTELIFQTQSYLAYISIIKELQPKVLVVESDRYSSTVNLVLAAKKLGIISISLMHGIIFKNFGFTPLLADFILVWGEIQKKILVKAGIDPQKIFVTGAPQLTEGIVVEKVAARSKFSVPDKMKVALLATNRIMPELREKLVREFAQAIDLLDNYVGYVKTHPSEDPTFYATIVAQYPKIQVHGTETLGFEESFALADVVCCYSTAYAFDALMKKVPLIIINIDNEHLGYIKHFVDDLNIPLVQNSAELTEVLKRLETLEPKKQDSISNYYCKNYGDVAAKEVIKSINQLINSE
ncbi:MAG: hypothetical protein DHS20C18_24630 [Saprospiraceae bacterium]|nr:MAG: hypothetical protein DHS20C18_24630 [Saprospiraceae bacterium]